MKRRLKVTSLLVPNKNLKKIQNNPIFSSTVDKINKFFPANAASCGKRGDDEFFQMSKEEDSNISRADKDNKERLNKRFDFRPINEGSDDQEKEIVDNDECIIKIQEETESKSSISEITQTITSSNSDDSSGSETSSKVSVNEEFRQNLINSGAIRVYTENRAINLEENKTITEDTHESNRIAKATDHLRTLSKAKYMRK